MKLLPAILAITIFLDIFSQQVDAQTLTPLTATSEFICVGADSVSKIGKFTKTGYKLFSTGAAKDLIITDRADYQSNADFLKNARAVIAKDKKLKKDDSKKVKAILKALDSPKLLGSLSEQVALLTYAANTLKGLTLLKKAELQALKDCVNNKTDPNIVAGTQKPQVIVVRYQGGEGIAVLAVLIKDSRIDPAGGYCVKEGSSPAYELDFASNPCPDVLTSKVCEGILGRYKIGHFVEGGAIYQSPPGEAEIQSLVGLTLANVNSKSYQIRRITSDDAGKSCGQIFGE